MSQSTLAKENASRIFAPNSAGRRGDIQGLRAIAVIVVVVFHAGLALPGGFVGVDIFFVISGFVITQMLSREFNATGSIDLARFFVRRFKRLTPALVLVLLVTLLLSAFLQSPLGEQKTTAATALGGIGLVANAIIFRTTGGYFEPAADTNPLLHIWSLSVEEQFYVIFPFLMLGLFLLARRSLLGPRIVLISLATASLISGAVAFAVAYGAELPLHPFLISYYSPFTRAWEFGVGALLALAPLLGDPRQRKLPMFACIAGIGLVAASALIITESVPFPGPATLLPVLGTSLLLYGGGYPQNPLNRFLGSRPFAFVGDISYSWYLWHWPMIVFAMALFRDPLVIAFAAFVSFLPALASYYWIEQPMRNIGVSSKLGFLRLMTVVVAPALLLAGSIIVASGNGWGLERVQAIQALHPGWSNCMSFATMPNGPAKNPNYDQCRWNQSSTGRPVFLVGDSNASQFSGPLIDASANEGRPLWMRTAGGCPFIDVYRQQGPTHEVSDELCRDYYESTLSWLEGQAEGTVFISSTEGYWIEKNMLIGASRSTIQESATMRAAALEEGLARTVGALKAAGHDVVLIQPLPHPTFSGHKDVPTRCSVISLAANQCELTVPRSEIDAAQAPARHAMDIAASSRGAMTLDLSGRFCDEQSCSLNRDGELQYQDPLHLTTKASRALTPEFINALQRQN